MKYTNSEVFELPSKGKIYGREINPEVEIRSMTTADEMRRTAPSEYYYKKMCNLLESCLVKPLGIPVYDLCIGDYQFLIHKLRVVTFGPEYNVALRCPYCGEVFKTVINLDDLVVSEYTEAFDDMKKIHLPQCDKEVELRVQTPRILDEIAIKTKERNKKIKDSVKNPEEALVDQSYMVTLIALIKSVDGQPLNEAAAEQFVQDLPMRDANILIQKAEKLNTLIGIKPGTTVRCPNPKCDEDIEYSFRITGELWGPTVD